MMIWMNWKKGRQFSFKMNDFCLIILAAGRGTRLKLDIPKPLVKIGNKYLIEPIIEKGLELNFGQIVVVVSKYTEQVMSIFKDPRIDYVYIEPNGTGQAVMEAIKIVRCPKLIIAQADDSFFYSKDSILKLAKLHKQKKALITFSVYHLHENKEYTPIRFDQDLRLTYVSMDSTDRNVPAPKYINCGLYVGDVDWLRQNLPKIQPNDSGEIGLPFIFNYCPETDKRKFFVFVLPDGEWQGVNTVEELEEARQKFIQRGD